MTKSNQREKMTQEIAIHQTLNHRHIVGFHGFFDDAHNIYIILELCRKRVGIFSPLSPHVLGRMTTNDLELISINIESSSR